MGLNYRASKGDLGPRRKYYAFYRHFTPTPKLTKSDLFLILIWDTKIREGFLKTLQLQDLRVRPAEVVVRCQQ